MSGPSESLVYFVSIELPNALQFTEVEVTVGTFGDFDVLIGMDIITMGDLAITNLDGRTTFSFRVPSLVRIDFAAPEADSRP